MMRKLFREMEKAGHLPPIEEQKKMLKEAIERAGHTVFTVWRGGSGSKRRLSVILIKDSEVLDITLPVAQVLNLPYKKGYLLHNSGEWLVYHLANTLWGANYPPLTQRWI